MRTGSPMSTTPSTSSQRRRPAPVFDDGARLSVCHRRECLVQMPELCGGNRRGDRLRRRGSNAMGIFYAYIPYEGVKLIGVEAADSA